jgi:UTP-glucose-1-phosphate uridylyltransferase
LIEPGERGEGRLTDALDRAAPTTGLAGFAVRDEDGRIVVGNWQGWLDTNVQIFANDDAPEALVVATKASS